MKPKIKKQVNTKLKKTNTIQNYDKSILNFYYDNVPKLSDKDISDLKYQSASNKNKPKDKLISVCLVIPTYNEAKNIPKLLKGIYGNGRQQKYDQENIMMNVLVVDDNSPDGTADIVKAYAETNSNIYLLLRKEKNGLGAAYIAGMQYAIKLLEPDIIFEMDGDLSHDPEYILPMINKIREGADFVIGSRYIKGGSIPETWGMMRKLISKSANFYAKTVLRIKDVNDCTGGFRAIRVSVLRQIDLSSLKTKGYAFQISLLEEMRRNKVIMKEVPIAFKDRTNGASKMRIYDILEEGLFVLRASIENIFSPKVRTVNAQSGNENWVTTNDSNYNAESTFSQVNVNEESFEAKAES